MPVVWSGQAHAALVRAAVSEVLESAADALLEEASQTIPHASGAMELSGDTHVDGHDAQVFYQGPYVIRQHEDLTLRHPDPTNPNSSPNGRGRWLELATKEHAPRLIAQMALDLKRRIG